MDILHTVNNAINILNEGLAKIRIEGRTRIGQSYVLQMSNMFAHLNGGLFELCEGLFEMGTFDSGLVLRRLLLKEEYR